MSSKCLSCDWRYLWCRGQGCIRRAEGGGSERGGGGWLRPPSYQGPPMVPAEGGLKNFKLKSPWGRSKILAVSLNHWKRRKGWGRGSRGGYRPSSYIVRRCRYIPACGAGSTRTCKGLCNLSRLRPGTGPSIICGLIERSAGWTGDCCPSLQRLTLFYDC